MIHLWTCRASTSHLAQNRLNFIAILTSIQLNYHCINIQFSEWLKICKII